MVDRLNLVVIGVGPGGYETAIEGAKKGMKVALVENRELGGTCPNRGCIPTKAILHTADLYHELQVGPFIGFVVSGAEVNMDAVQIHKDKVSEQLRRGIASLMRVNKISVYYGMGTIIDRDMVKVTTIKGETIEGPVMLETDYILIVTGSVPACPPIPDSDLPGVAISDGLLEKIDMSEHLVIIDGNVIGMESAPVYIALGCEVTMIEALDRIPSGMDKEIAQNPKTIFKKRGAEIHTGVKVEPIQAVGDGSGLICRYVEKEKPCEARADGVLTATSKKAYTEGLITQESSHQIQAMAMERGRIVTNEYYETSVPGIYGVGDVMGGIQLAHAVTAQGRNAAPHMAGEIMKIRAEVMPSCIYTSPEIRCVGISADEAKEQGRPVITKKCLMFADEKSVLFQQKRGLIKVVVDSESHRILGAQMMCVRVTDMTSQFGTAIVNGLTPEDVARAILPHPTFSEGTLEAVRD